MDDNTLTIGIMLAVIVTVGIVAKTLLGVRETKIVQEREREARELELKIRMSSGLDVITEFNELARVYVLLNRLSDAENCMRKALAITENELGQMDPTLVPILQNYADVLDKMNRTVESERMRKRAREIPSKRSGNAG